MLAGLLLSACTLENGLSGKPGDSGTGGGEADSAHTRPDDSADTAGDTDTGGGVETGDACDGRDLPAEAVPVDPDCSAGAYTPAWSLEELWHHDVEDAVYAHPVVGQLTDDDGDGDVDADDRPDVVVVAASGRAIALDAATGALHWSAPAEHGYEATTAALGDLDGDGFPDVFFVDSFGSVALHGEDGGLLWTGAGLDGGKAMCGLPGIADLDADGAAEAYFGRTILDGATGETRGVGEYGVGASMTGEGFVSVAVDADLDGLPELIAGNAAYDADGHALWANGAWDGAVAVADVDGDGRGEIVTVGEGDLSLYEDDGALLWTATLPADGKGAGGPAIADFDGDGDLEFAASAMGKVAVIETDGTVRWAADDKGSYDVFGASITAADLDGDGAWEVLDAGAAAVDIRDGATGELLASYSRDVWSACGQAAVPVDIDGDGRSEILTTDNTSPTGSVRAFRDAAGFAPGVRHWNQGAFSITNADADGTIPTTPVVNWPAYNSFRAAPPTGPGTRVPNVAPRIEDVCALDCGAGAVRVWYTLANDGAADLDGPLTLRFYAVLGGVSTLVHEEVWSGTLASGARTAGIALDLAGVPTPSDGLAIVADPSGAVDECDESDNTQQWTGELCR